MKISVVQGTSVGTGGVAANADLEVNQLAENFKAELQNVTQDNCKKYLLELKDKITKQGIILSERADVQELQRYRAMVSEFLSESMRFIYAFNRESFFNSAGQHQVLSTVKKVDEKLERLTSEVLSEQQDNIKIANIIDDIRGLILDVLM